MPGLSLDEAILDTFLQDNRLDSPIVNAVTLAKLKIAQNEPIEFTDKEREVYNRVISNLDEIELLLKNICGNTKEANCPLEATGDNGYYFHRLVNGRKYCISIEKDNFFWTIGVAYDGDFWELRDKVYITGYYHVDTTGSLNNIKEALKSTEKYFPKAHRFHHYEIRLSYLNSFSMHELIKKILETQSDFSYKNAPENHFITFERLSPENAEIEAEKLIKNLKLIHPTITVTKSLDENSNIIVILLKKEIPSLLTAADKPQKEMRDARKVNTTSNSLRWLAAKSIWKKLPLDEIKTFQTTFPDLNALITKAKKFS